VVGGFVDRDETTSQAAAREVMEETGWQLKNLQLLTIRDNPDRPHEDRQNISFVYLAEAVGQTGQPDWESDEVKWFPLDNLPPREQIAFDHAASIDLYARYLKENFTLPVLPQP
jgi:8-oxo-dGTP diphosphatase